MPMYSVLDPGLQPQRTAMAWLRTTAVAWVVFLLHLRTYLQHPMTAQAVLVLGLWAVVALGFTAQYAQRKKHLLESAVAVVACSNRLVALSFMAFLSTFISAFSL